MEVARSAKYWQQVEEYLHERIDASFTHGICPACMEKPGPDAGDEPPRYMCKG